MAIAGRRHLERRALRRAAHAGLLDGVRDLVGDELLAARGAGLVLAVAEVHRLADGDRARRVVARRRRRDRVGVQAHAAEVGAEAALEGGPQVRRQRRAVAGLEGLRERGLARPLLGLGLDGGILRSVEQRAALANA
ncbi:MAG: hypothetical protein R2939_15285 [Kofleriaceae bacterium]